MLKRSNVYLFFFVFIFFIACKKEDLVAANDYKDLGTSAHDLLASNNYTSLEIEVSYMTGYEPETASLDSLAIFLEQYLNKPDGIRIFPKAIPSSGKQSLTLSEIVNIEKKNRRFFTTRNTLSVHILITDGAYSIWDNIALAYWNTSFCLFGERILASSGGPGQVTRQKLFATLLQHEFGHLLGLVGQGSPMQQNHRDEDNDSHCINPLCLMYYGIETGDNLSGSSTTPKLDAHCIADLKANGGK